MLLWSLNDFMDEQACYEFLAQVFHPDGLKCPLGHPLPPDQAPHDRHRAPIYDYQCRECGKVYNMFTGTLFRGSHYSPKVWLLLTGCGRPTPTPAKGPGPD